MILRCTNKLLKEMGLANTDLPVQPSDSSLLGDWYANLFFLSRRKCVLFTNERTFFSLVAFDVNRSQIEKLGSLFCEQLGRTLLDEGFGGSLIQKIINECQDMQYGRTCDKSILGVMNGSVMDIKGMVVWRDGGIDKSDLSSVIMKLNRIPLKPLQYHFAIEELKRALDDKSVTHDT